VTLSLSLDLRRDVQATGMVTFIC